MNRRTVLGTLFSLPAAIAYAQDAARGRVARRGSPAADARPARTMKTLARGTDYAVSSLMPQSSLTAERVLHAGGVVGHWGLRGARERAQQIGARLDFWSEAGAGTEVQLTVPAAIAYEKATERRRFSLLRKA